MEYPRFLLVPREFVLESRVHAATGRARALINRDWRQVWCSDYSVLDAGLVEGRGTHWDGLYDGMTAFPVEHEEVDG